MAVRRVCSSALLGKAQCRRMTSSPASIRSSQLDLLASHENSARSARMASLHEPPKTIVVQAPGIRVWEQHWDTLNGPVDECDPLCQREQAIVKSDRVPILRPLESLNYFFGKALHCPQRHSELLPVLHNELITECPCDGE